MMYFFKESLLCKKSTEVGMCGDEDSGFLFSGGGGVHFSTNRQIQQDINQKYERLNSLTETRIWGFEPILSYFSTT